MARVQLEMPPEFPFCTEMQICFSQINVGNHLDYVQLLNFVTEARVRFLRWLGYTEREVAGLALPVGDLVVQYLNEGLYGETLCIEMKAEDFTKYGFDLLFRIREKQTGRDIARGKVGMVFLDRQTRKVQPVPEAFRERLREYGH
jgi:acyl-CoA thioester hydrolase